MTVLAPTGNGSSLSTPKKSVGRSKLGRQAGDFCNGTPEVEKRDILAVSLTRRVAGP